MQMVEVVHKCDGIDDAILNKKNTGINYLGREFFIEKQNDICGKKYEVIAAHKFLYEKLGKY